MSSRRVRGFTTLAVFAMLSGCGDPPPEKAAVPANAPKPTTAPKAAALSSQMVAAVSAGKSASAIGVHFALGSAPAANKPLPVQIVLVTHQKFATLSAHFEGHDGLEVSMGADFGPVNDIAEEKSIEHQLMLLPTKEGMFMVTVSVDSVADEGNAVRIFSIPVIVGAASAAETSAPK